MVRIMIGSVTYALRIIASMAEGRQIWKSVRIGSNVALDS